jgi:hypothetical protein
MEISQRSGDKALMSVALARRTAVAAIPRQALASYKQEFWCQE